MQANLGVFLMVDWSEAWREILDGQGWPFVGEFGCPSPAAMKFFNQSTPGSGDPPKISALSRIESEFQRMHVCQVLPQHLVAWLGSLTVDLPCFSQALAIQ